MALEKEAPPFFDFEEQSSSDTPDSGYVRVYAKTDGSMYQKDDAGTETALGGGGGGAPTDATYITQTANGTLTNEQALSSLSTGLAVVTNGTGVISTVAAPTGTVVGTSDSQTLTNKTMAYGSNTFTGFPFLSGAATLSYLHTLNYNSTSTSWADVDGTNLKVTFTLQRSSSTVVMLMQANFDYVPGTGSADFRGIMDDATASGNSFSIAQQPNGVPMILTFIWTGVSSGSHAFEPQFQVTTDGTARITAQHNINITAWEL